MRFWCHQPTHPQRSGERPGQGRDDRPAGPCRPANGQALAEVALVMEPVRRPSGKVGNGVELDLPVSLQAAAGIADPAAFTGAWIASSLRQTRRGPGGLQLSGLAAPDARDPWIMLAGFLVAGGCTAAFGAALASTPRAARDRGPASSRAPAC
jgi:hypothetical protein